MILRKIITPKVLGVSNATLFSKFSGECRYSRRSKYKWKCYFILMCKYAWSAKGKENYFLSKRRTNSCNYNGYYKISSTKRINI